MSKPWDTLRDCLPPPIRPGEWRTGGGAKIEVTTIEDGNVRLRIGGWFFNSNCLRQLAEFCHELADQLEADG